MWDVQPGDRVQMRKVHPCGGDEWLVYRIGADIGIQCQRCQRRVLLSRRNFFKSVKHVILSKSPQRGDQS